MKRFIMLLSTLLLPVWAGPLHAAPQVAVGISDVIATVQKSFTADSNGQMPINDFTADFFQRTTLKKQQREMRAEGQLSVRMPSNGTPLMYRFDYLRPYNQEIVSDGASLWIYHPENREVILADVSFLDNRNKFNPDRDRSVNFLQGLSKISKDFQINFASGMTDVAGNYVLELTPRRSMLNTRRIYLVVSRECVLSFINAKNPAPAPAAPPPTFPVKRQPFDAITPYGPRSDEFPILSTTVDDHEGNRNTMEFTNIRINNRLLQTLFTFSIPPNVQTVRPSEQTLPH